MLRLLRDYYALPPRPERNAAIAAAGRMVFGLHLVLAWLVLPCSFAAAGGLRLPSLFGDDACVQAQRPIRIWGWSSAGDQVAVSLGTSTAKATAASDGRWQTELPPLAAGGPYELVVKGTAGGEIHARNLVAGEVWLASGQSNMFFPLAETSDAGTDLPVAAQPMLRLFREEVIPSFTASKTPRGKWVICTPETAKNFSGVAYYFGRDLLQKLGAPVGLIQTSLGGTPIEGWVAPETWSANPEMETLRKNQEARADRHKRKRFERTRQAKGRPRSTEPTEPAEPTEEPDYGEVDQNDPSVCYNSGIVPFVGYTLAGFLWYQGEWNASHAAEYKTMLPLLITQWRGLWAQGDLPFYVVQLPNVGKAPDPAVTARSAWAELREGQLSALTLPNTGVAVTIDVGGPLHPTDKRTVGERLARQALAKTYTRKVAADGPAFTGAEAGDGQLRLRFTHAEGLLLRPSNGQTGFAVAGDDRRFYLAEAKAEGESVIVSSPSVSKPTQARYLWANNPSATLFNGEGLPASPFRTDRWDKYQTPPNPK